MKSELQALADKIEGLSTQRKIHLGISIFFGIIILIGGIFFLQAFKETQAFDAEKFKALEQQNRQIEQKVQALKAEVAENRLKIEARNREKEAIAQSIQTIDSKLSKIATNEKVNRVYSWNDDSLNRYFSNIRNSAQPYLDSNQ